MTDIRDQKKEGGFRSRLARARAGATLPMVAAAMIPIVAGVGMAVDLGRIYLVKSQMQAAADAAALAGARSFNVDDGSSADRDTQVATYFRDNFPDGFMGSGTRIIPTATFAVTNSVNRTTVTASKALPMVLMRIFGFAPKQISVTAVAEGQPRPLEVMVVLDNTGSMTGVLPDGVTRIAAIKAAMTDFIDVLHQGATMRPELAMGIINYTHTTNVGALLTEAGVSIQQIDGYTSNLGAYPGRSPGLEWGGCVAVDATVRDVSADPNTFETGAYDIDKSLPGENGHPAIPPYLYPPNADNKPASGPTPAKTGFYATSSKVPADYLTTPGDPSITSGPEANTNNLYRLVPATSNNSAVADSLASSPAFRRSFFNQYIGLNYNTDPTDDVIIQTNGTNFAAGTSGSLRVDGTNWNIKYSRIPNINVTDTSNANYVWMNPTLNYGYTPATNSWDLNPGSPNWQCPAPALKLAYGQAKSTYSDYVQRALTPIKPAYGTIHQLGMLWGYRLLTRDDVFIRTNPIEGEVPIRALVFMTDGEALGRDNVNWDSGLGARRDKLVSSQTTLSSLLTQSMRRFAKICQAAKNDGIKVYIVSLVEDAPEFSACAGRSYIRTNSQAEIKQAFSDIAADLVDLHLTQ